MDDEEKKGASMVRNIIMGVVLIILLGVVAFVYWDKFGKKDEKSSDSAPGGSVEPALVKV